MACAILKNALCHGQYFCIYPAAWTAEERHDYMDPIVPDFIVNIQTSDRITLKCALMKQTDLPVARGTVILFHGNAYHWWHYASCGHILSKMGFNALMVSYRGYGDSEGKPSERGLRRDAQAALDYVLADELLGSVPTILHGRSLGGAVAIDLASRNPTKIHAVIVENTFLSIPRVVKKIPILRYLTFLIHERWNSESKVPKIPRATPILFLSGKMDEVVPEAHMHRLRDIAADRDPKSEAELLDMFESFPYGGHNDTMLERNYFQTIDRFVTSLAETRAGGTL